MTTEHKTVCVSSEAWDALDYLSRITHIPKIKIMDEIFTSILEIAVSLENCEKSSRIGFMTENSILAQEIKISLIGRNKIACGAFEAPIDTPEPEISKSVKERVEDHFEKNHEGQK